jgi:hypothetical protein
VLSPLTGPGYGSCQIVQRAVRDGYGRIVAYRPVETCHRYGEYP